MNGSSGGGVKQHVTYGVRQPLRKDVSWWASLVLASYLGALGYYLVRACPPAGGVAWEVLASRCPGGWVHQRAPGPWAWCVVWGGGGGGGGWASALLFNQHRPITALLQYVRIALTLDAPGPSRA